MAMLSFATSMIWDILDGSANVPACFSWYANDTMNACCRRSRSRSVKSL